MLTITRKKPTYDSGIIKDGVKLELLPMSKSMIEKITEIGAEIDILDTESKIKEFYSVCQIILNSNSAGIVISREEVEEIDILTAVEIIMEYTKFATDLKNFPN